MDFTSLDAHWIWMSAGAALIIAELATGSMFLLWPGLAALIFAVAIWIEPSLPVAVQLSAFAALTVGLAAIGRGYLKMRPGAIPSDRPNLNERGAELVGRRVLAAEDFVNGYGPVTLGDSRWSAKLEDHSAAAPQGAALVVRAVDGVQLVVAPA